MTGPRRYGSSAEPREFNSFIIMLLNIGYAALAISLTL